jgi:hypothetical protein
VANKTWLLTSTGDLNVSGNWSPSGVPSATDNVRFPAGSPAITASLTSLNTSTLSGALGTVVFEEGFTGAVGTSSTNMQFTCTRFDFSGTGIAYIDLEASSIAPQVFTTAGAGAGSRGLYLKGSALTTLNVEGGSVGIAYRSGETSTVATIRCYGPSADVVAGSGTTLTTFYQTAGTSVIRCAATTVTCYGGTLKTTEAGAITTLNVRGGIVYPESTGTITTLNAIGGTTNFRNSGAARTVTTLSQDVSPGGISQVNYDPAVVTVTNLSAPSYPVLRVFSSP